jgi:predicted DNA-binding antitoxin AbrB/MazE fold protein
MSLEFNAIYEDGVLRPLTPLNLPEAAQVTLELRDRDSAKNSLPSKDPLLGLMADDCELVDEVVAAALAARETHPLRTKD